MLGAADALLLLVREFGDLVTGTGLAIVGFLPWLLLVSTSLKEVIEDFEGLLGDCDSVF